MIDWPVFWSDCHGRWRDILINLGMDAKHFEDVHGACPWCGGKDRWHWHEDKQAAFCNQCCGGKKRQDGWDLAKRFTGETDNNKLAERIKPLVGSAPPPGAKPKDPEERKEYMKKIWKESHPFEPGDPVGLYLQRRCGPLADIIEVDGIRIHPNLLHTPSKTFHPTLLAPMGVSRPYGGIMRIYLAKDGHKADVQPAKMAFGDWGHVCLQRIALGTLGIAEGMETALAASQIFHHPFWATGKAGMQTFEPPPGVNHLFIAGDNDTDTSWTGQATAYALANRLSNQVKYPGLKIEVAIPSAKGFDWCDEWGELRYLKEERKGIQEF